MMMMCRCMCGHPRRPSGCRWEMGWVWLQAHIHKPGVVRDKKVLLLYSPEEGALLNLKLGETRRRVPCTLQKRVLC